MMKYILPNVEVSKRKTFPFDKRTFNKIFIVNLVVLLSRAQVYRRKLVNTNENIKTIAGIIFQFA